MLNVISSSNYMIVSQINNKFGEWLSKDRLNFPSPFDKENLALLVTTNQI